MFTPTLTLPLNEGEGKFLRIRFYTQEEEITTSHCVVLVMTSSKGEIATSYLAGFARA